jgi:tetrahydromethanopterin S-methyltransferase subunit G
VKKIKSTFLLLLVSLFSGCLVHVTVKNTKACAVAGVMAAGADCAYTLTDKTESMTLDELIDFLEPQPERPDPKNPGKMLPARGPAIIQSSDDWNHMKTALEQACAALEDRCSYETQQMIKEAGRRVGVLYGGNP